MVTSVDNRPLRVFSKIFIFPLWSNVSKVSSPCVGDYPSSPGGYLSVSQNVFVFFGQVISPHHSNLKGHKSLGLLSGSAFNRGFLMSGKATFRAVWDG